MATCIMAAPGPGSARFYCSHVPDLRGFLRGKLTDVTLITKDGGRLEAHRARLAAVSPLMDRIFAGAEQASELLLPDLTLSTARLLLHFLYTGFMKASAEEVDDILAAVKMLGIDRAIDVEGPGLVQSQPVEKRPLRQRQDNVAKKQKPNVYIFDQADKNHKVGGSTTAQPATKQFMSTVGPSQPSTCQVARIGQMAAPQPGTSQTPSGARKNPPLLGPPRTPLGPVVASTKRVSSKENRPTLPDRAPQSSARPTPEKQPSKSPPSQTLPAKTCPSSLQKSPSPTPTSQCPESSHPVQPASLNQEQQQQQTLEVEKSMEENDGKTDPMILESENAVLSVPVTLSETLCPQRPMASTVATPPQMPSLLNLMQSKLANMRAVSQDKLTTPSQGESPPQSCDPPTLQTKECGLSGQEDQNVNVESSLKKQSPNENLNTPTEKQRENQYPIESPTSKPAPISPEKDQKSPNLDLGESSSTSHSQIQTLPPKSPPPQDMSNPAPGASRDGDQNNKEDSVTEASGCQEPRASTTTSGGLIQTVQQAVAGLLEWKSTRTPTQSPPQKETPPAQSPQTPSPPKPAKKGSKTKLTLQEMEEIERAISDEFMDVDMDL